jgi:hypothetical protein
MALQPLTMSNVAWHAGMQRLQVIKMIWLKRSSAIFSIMLFAFQFQLPMLSA